ncbi:hypothetical protein RRG08_033141 [Elysia crispata]|uniref:Uncharacterized protein n=1 Tax=Elysia crispata TaxID=231223 RepID=A0AAE0YAZ7_9GAST|nr:hypothetical protein RRG08_033141 [Elysia crispata]
MWLPRDDIYPEVSAKALQVDKQGSLRNKTQHLNNNRWFSQSACMWLPREDDIYLESPPKLSSGQTRQPPEQNTTLEQQSLVQSVHIRSLVLVVTRRDKCCQLHVSYRTLNTSETLKTVCAARWADTNDGVESTGTNYARLPVLKLIDTLLEGKGNRGVKRSLTNHALPCLVWRGVVTLLTPANPVTGDLETAERSQGDSSHLILSVTADLETAERSQGDSSHLILSGRLLGEMSRDLTQVTGDLETAGRSQGDSSHLILSVTGDLETAERSQGDSSHLILSVTGDLETAERSQGDSSHLILSGRLLGEMSRDLTQLQEILRQQSAHRVTALT